MFPKAKEAPMRWRSLDMVLLTVVALSMALLARSTASAQCQLNICERVNVVAFAIGVGCTEYETPTCYYCKRPLGSCQFKTPGAPLQGCFNTGFAQRTRNCACTLVCPLEVGGFAESESDGTLENFGAAGSIWLCSY
jgi:hypothetical protein